jgi:hypothetical protein
VGRRLLICAAALPPKMALWPSSCCLCVPLRQIIVTYILFIGIKYAVRMCHVDNRDVFICPAKAKASKLLSLLRLVCEEGPRVRPKQGKKYGARRGRPSRVVRAEGVAAQCLYVQSGCASEAQEHPFPHFPLGLELGAMPQHCCQPVSTRNSLHTLIL